MFRYSEQIQDIRMDSVVPISVFSSLQSLRQYYGKAQLISSFGKRLSNSLGKNFTTFVYRSANYFKHQFFSFSICSYCHSFHFQFLAIFHLQFYSILANHSFSYSIRVYLSYKSGYLSCAFSCC